MARRGLTVKAIENLQATTERYEVPDPGCAGLYLQVHPTGAKSWAYRYRFAGRSKKLTIGTAYTDSGLEVIRIGDARDIADAARVSVAKRIDPSEAKKEDRRRAEREARAGETTLKVKAEEYLDQIKHLRSTQHRRKVYERLIYPKFGDRQIETIKRSEISALMREIARTRGAPMADYCLAMLRALFNNYAANSDDYVSPIIRGMALTSTTARARSRVLGEIELRALWRACDGAGIFGQYVRFTLLTATRRNEAAYLRRSEIEGTDWTIPAERYKTKIDHVVPLSAAAVAVLAKVPSMGSAYVFTSDGRKLSGFGCRKAAFDNLMLAELRKIAAEAGDDPASVELKRWTLHDLRRTARTLMSQAGLPSDHAEACLGHVKRGVEGTYDRYQYRKEKADAFAKLADLIDFIVHPPVEQQHHIAA